MGRSPQAAVAVLIRRAGTPGAEVLLGKRLSDPRDPWSGQISFPGGHAESSDADLLDTAVRELHEESGLVQDRTSLTGRLPDDHAGSGTNEMAVTPWLFLGDFPEAPGGDGEIVRWAWVPLSLLDGPRVPAPAGQTGVSTPLGLLWGMTLRILDGLWQRPLLPDIHRLLLDFDGTFYPHDHPLFSVIDRRISLYVARIRHLSEEAGDAHRRELYQKYGNTLHGLMAEGLTDQPDYLRFVFDIPDSDFPGPAPEIGAALERIALPADIFTNAESSYVRRCLRLMGLGEWSGAIYDLPFFKYDCKPHAAVYEMVKACCTEPAAQAIFVDDKEENCIAGHEAGYRTTVISEALQDCSRTDFRIRSLPELTRLLLPHLGA